MAVVVAVGGKALYHEFLRLLLEGIKKKIKRREKEK